MLVDLVTFNEFRNGEGVSQVKYLLWVSLVQVRTVLKEVFCQCNQVIRSKRVIVAFKKLD